MTIIEKAEQAKQVAPFLAELKSEVKNKALVAIAKNLKKNRAKIIEANTLDLEKAVAENLEAPLLKRLKFDDAKIDAVCAGIESLINLPDPVNRTLSVTELDKNLELTKLSCPIGVIGIIFESRPDALVQISTLCLKSGNAVLLKGGSEASSTNSILAECIVEATRGVAYPDGWLHLLETRADVSEMLKLDRHIDLIIPRGSNSFVRYIMNNSNIPVMGHADGICHLFIDESADLNMALELTDDSKTQYVAVCNALETLLVHEKVAQSFLPKLKKRFDEKHVRLIGCERTRAIITVDTATDEDWASEYLDYILSVKVVSSLDEAIDHINRYGSGHTDSIVSENAENADRFMARVDSGNVFWNVSTRFSDGYVYGLGAEVGISTAKIHARGPVGLEGLVIYKYRLKGHGARLAPYASGEKQFTHKTK